MPDEPTSTGADPGPLDPSEPSGQEPAAPAANGARRRHAAQRSGKLHQYRERRRAAKARRSKLRRRVTRSAIALALLLVVVVGGGAIFVEVQVNRIHHVSVPNLSTAANAAGGGTVENILLVGSTSRCAVTSSKYLKNFNEQCQAGVNGVNSDVIMIIHLAPGKTPTLLSIPRDTFVPDARAGGLYNKIDAALADGPSQLVEAIQEDFGIPITHYVVLNFGTFANIVTALGGITMYFPTTLYDSQSGLYISHSGCLHISGLEALALVRARHLNYDYDPRTKTWLGYDPSGDIGRIERVHVFLKVLASEVATRGLSNPITDSELLAALAPDLTVDTGFSTHEMADLVLSYHANVGGAPEYTLPVIEDSVEYQYKGYSYGLVVFPAAPQDQETIDTFLGVDQTADEPAASSFSLSVLDGDDSPSEAASTAQALTALGFHVTATGETTSVGPVVETTINYKKGYLAEAEEVERAFTGTVSLGEVGTADGADVTVTTGTDQSIAAPPVSNTASSSTSSRSSSDPTVLATLLSAVLDADATSTPANPDLAAPTPAVSNLPAYDPRACPTGTSSSKSSKKKSSK